MIMTLQRLILTFKPDGLEVRTLYRSKGGPNPGTKARRREVAQLARTGLLEALEASYVESVRRWNARVRAENRAAWLAFHEDQADRLRRNLGALVAHHKAEADKYRNHHQHEGAA